MQKAEEEASKTPEEKQKIKQNAIKHKQAVAELKSLQDNEQTQAIAELTSAMEIETLAENMRGSGESEEEEIKKLKEEQEKHRKEHLKKEKEKQKALVQKKQKAKVTALQRKKHIEEAYKKLQTQHGGLNGTDNTGYDDDSMEAYIKSDFSHVLLSEDSSVEEFENLLMEHRNSLLVKEMDR